MPTACSNGRAIAGAWRKAMTTRNRSPPRKNPVDADVWNAGTFDNDATTLGNAFPRAHRRGLARVAHAAVYREAFLRGLRTFFARSIEWRHPQIYPLVGRLPHDAITYKRRPMTQALEVMRYVADGRPELPSCPRAAAASAARASRAGLACILCHALKDSAAASTGVVPAARRAHVEAVRRAQLRGPIASSTNESGLRRACLMAIPQPLAGRRSHRCAARFAWFEARPRKQRHRVEAARRATRNSWPVPGAPPIWSACIIRHG